MRWTDEHFKILREEYGKVRAEELAQKIGTSREAVRLKASMMGLSRKIAKHGFVWTDDKVQLLKDCYESEEIAVLCQKLGAHISTIRRKAVSLGLHSNVGKVRAGRQASANRTTLDIHYFDHWSPKMAWITGFLFADGSLNKRGDTVVIGLASQDECILKHIRKELKVAKKITHREPYVDKKGYQHKPSSYLYLGNRLLIEQLQRLGLRQRKTYTDEPFPSVPDEMMPHFIRGYFDGDGAAYVHKDKRWPNTSICHLKFVGSPRFITGLRDAVVQLAGLKHRETTREGNKTIYSRVSWSARSDLNKFYAFTYPPSFGFGLERKRQVLYNWLTAKPEHSKGD